MQACRTGEAWPRACKRQRAGWHLEGGYHGGRPRLTEISLAVMSEIPHSLEVAREKSMTGGAVCAGGQVTIIHAALGDNYHHYYYIDIIYY